MKKNAKVAISIGAAAVVMAVLLTAIVGAVGGDLDVIASRSVASLDAVLNALPDPVQRDEARDGWSLAAPDGSARFIWRGDFSGSQPYDVMLEVGAKPFTDAGLDAAKLPDGYTARGGTLTVGARLGGEPNLLAQVGDKAATPLSSYQQIANHHRTAIGYHMAMDHFGVKLGEGMFEWAKDLSKNTVTGEDQDKDIVFVLNPEPLIAAGVDPERVEGWVYAQVDAHENGQMVNAYKFLKPFNLK